MRYFQNKFKLVRHIESELVLLDLLIFSFQGYKRNFFEIETVDNLSIYQITYQTELDIIV